MAREIICEHCKIKIELNDPQKIYKKKKYHMPCYKKIIAEQYQTSVQHSQDKEKLMSYINKWFNLNKNDPKLSRQVDKLYEDYNIGYYDIYRTLDYFFRIKGNNPLLKYGIIVVAQYYTQAREYWKSVDRAKEKNKGKAISNTMQTVAIKQPDYAGVVKLYDIDKI